MRKQKGFTLIELMVVIVILGILAAVIAPRIPSFVDKAKEGRTKGNLATLRSTLNIYYSDNDGWYPTSTDQTTFSAAIVPKLIKKVPECETVKTGHGKSSTVGYFGTTVGATDTGNWGYNNQSTHDGWGDVWVQCTHTDNSSTVWTTY